MTTERLIHEGRNVKRIREMLGIKQDALALELGDDWNQKKISLLEQKESIEPATLEEVAKALKVPVEALKNFDDVAAVNYFNTINDSSVNQWGNFGTYNFNPLEQWVQAIEENKKLYEALMKEKDDKITMLEGLLKAR
ncbi:MAG: helix-turn-helix transcriptional regulator [Bacteroidota bacterium]|nr:helix-turn-helix transcriptional regulator [Bacteroidota bacterium]